MSLASIALTLVGQALDSAKKPDQAAQIPAPNPRAPEPATLWALAAGDAPPGAASDEIHITTYLPDPEPLLALKYSGRTPRNAIKLPKWLTMKGTVQVLRKLAAWTQSWDPTAPTVPPKQLRWPWSHSKAGLSVPRSAQTLLIDPEISRY